MTDSQRDQGRTADEPEPCPAPVFPAAPAGTDGIPPEAAMIDPPVSPAARGPTIQISVEQAIALREQAPEMYDLWLRIAQEKAATANYVERAPYEVPERLAQSGRPRALGALVIVLSFCGYLAWLGGPGPYIGGLIAILDLAVMFGMFFGLRPERLPDPSRLERRDRGRLPAYEGARRSSDGCWSLIRSMIIDSPRNIGVCRTWRSIAAADIV
jgi:hypothetical protein